VQAERARLEADAVAGPLYAGKYVTFLTKEIDAVALIEATDCRQGGPTKRHVAAHSEVDVAGSLVVQVRREAAILEQPPHRIAWR